MRIIDRATIEPDKHKSNFYIPEMTHLEKNKGGS